MRELSPQFRALAEICASCGGPLPCALHDAALREAILRPPEELPWDRTDLAHLQGYIAGMVALPDHAYLVQSDNYTLRRFDPRRPQGEQWQNYLSAHEHSGGFAAFAVSPDGACLFAANDGRINYRNPSERRVRSMGFHSADSLDFATVITPHRDGSFLIGTSDGRFLRCDPSQQQAHERLQNIAQYDGGANVALIALPDGKMLTIDGDNRIVEVDPSRKEGIASRVIHEVPGVQALVPCADGTYLMGGERGVIIRLDLTKPEGEREEVLVHFGEPITSLVVLSDTAFVVAGAEGTIARYDISERVLRAARERKLDAPAIPPMPVA